MATATLPEERTSKKATAKRKPSSSRSKETTIEFSENGQSHTKTLKPVEVEHLSTDSRWNRPITRRVEEMGEHWSNALAQTIVISLRKSGEMVLIDGQHRAAAARIAGIRELIAEVHTGLTPEQEAQLFDELNTSRKTISALDRFRARVFYRDPAALAVEKMVTKRGGKIRETSNQGAVSAEIAAIASLERIYRVGGEELLAWALDTIKQGFDQLDSDTCSLMNLSGLLMLWKKHQDNIDQDHLVEALQENGYAALRRMAMAHRQLWGGTGVVNGYRAMIEVYNKGLPTARRLKP